jgi:tetratricopeptide (TPR) repeat protein
MLFAGFFLTPEPLPLRRMGLALSVLVILAFSYWTHERNYIWQNPITVWEDNIKKSPNKARVHGNLGKAYLDAGEYEKARIEFEKVIALDPKLLGAYDNLATIYIDHYKQYGRAREYLYEVLRQKDDYPSPYLNLGVINLRLRELPEAITNFQKVLELDPKNLLGHYNLAAAYFNLKDYPKAIAILNKGTSFWPRSSKLYGLLGITYYYQGDKEKAETVLRKALELDDKNMMAVEYLKKMMAGIPGEGVSAGTKP